MPGRKSPSGSKPTLRYIFARLYLFSMAVLFVVGVGVLFFYLFKGEGIPEGVGDFLKWIGGILLGQFAILVYSLEHLEKKEWEKAIRDKLMEPPRRELRKEDIGGGYYREEGGPDLPPPAEPLDLGDF